MLLLFFFPDAVCLCAFSFNVAIKQSRRARSCTNRSFLLIVFFFFFFPAFVLRVIFLTSIRFAAASQVMHYDRILLSFESWRTTMTTEWPKHTSIFRKCIPKRKIETRGFAMEMKCTRKTHLFIMLVNWQKFTEFVSGMWELFRSLGFTSTSVCLWFFFLHFSWDTLFALLLLSFMSYRVMIFIVHETSAEWKKCSQSYFVLGHFCSVLHHEPLDWFFFSSFAMRLFE